ncbi:Positive regulator of purine utilization [Fusarium austroafricanum]|uniref:Positive regulator of purine utilization n=1 Tax=Fusarium austroafricanum TaxID=2364996 RepID=A0A8H4KQW5_9HYPO|nr:Positive regulator of purine utilization [Fusarium austroafricanum]
MTQLIATIRSRIRGTIATFTVTGLPIGFITRLEARLAETEEALFRLVQSIDDPNDKHVSLKPSSLRKDDRIKEWDSLPLQNMDDIRVWYRNRSDQASSPADQIVSMEVDQHELPTHVTPSEPDPVEIPDDSSNDSGDGIVLPDIEDVDVSRNDITTPVQPGGSKAKEMEQKHPNMYF